MAPDITRATEEPAAPVAKPETEVAPQAQTPAAPAVDLFVEMATLPIKISQAILDFWTPHPRG